jgi:hypothetical protein
MSRLNSPNQIQAFLDELSYSTEKIYRCPLRVLREQKAHCFDGAVFAGLGLGRLGYPPFILELLPNERDDDHLIAPYKRDGYWGAVAKSNFVGLRFREPVYRTLRELVLSYFEQYYNVKGEKTLRGYTRPLNLTDFNPLGWMVKDDALEEIANRLDRIQRFSIIDETRTNHLSPVDPRSYQAGLLGANQKGLFQPGKRTKRGF